MAAKTELDDAPLASDEQLLWCAVLMRALQDAQGIGSVTSLEKAQARWFLTRNTRWFRQICELAGVDPDAVKESARKILHGQDS